MKSLTFEQILKIKSQIQIVDPLDILEKSDSERAIFIGLNLSGGNALKLNIDGATDPDDFHVTLAYGYHNLDTDGEDLSVRVSM